MSLDAQDKIGKHEVDARMVRALADLPERLGEEACTRFDQSVDSGVRSRQGFMVGFEGGICRGKWMRRLPGPAAQSGPGPVAVDGLAHRGRGAGRRTCHQARTCAP